MEDQMESIWPQHMRECEITQLLCKWSDQQAVDGGPVMLEQSAGVKARAGSEIACGLAVGEVSWALSSEVDCVAVVR